MEKRAFITGINGQDGSYLAEYLLSKGYKVSGMVRRNSVSENQTSRLNSIRDKVYIEYGDVTDLSSVMSLLKSIMPTEVYHLAAQSHVKVSFIEPIYTAQVNSIGTLNVLEACRLVCPGARIYNAASSEMMGNNIDTDNYQRETTRMSPVSPYGCSKLFAYNICRNYRQSYDMFISSGILFNHESIRRATNFVTTKVVKTAVEIYYGKTDKLILGNLKAYRDWGHAEDYVRAMHMILNYTVPDDFVIATGKSYSIKDLCTYVFDRLQLSLERYITSDQKYLRPEELNYLRGDSSKAREKLGWTPVYSFTMMLDNMIDYWLKELKNK